MMKCLFLPLIILLAACTPDPDPEPEPTEGTMTCTLNGETWTALTTKGELQIHDTPDGIAKRIDIYGSFGLTSSIGLGCVVEDTDLDEDVPTGTYREDGENFLTVIAYTEGITPVAVVDGFEEDSAKVIISRINAVTKKCSGTFEFWAHQWAGEEITHIATGGVFTDINYVVIP